MTYIKRQCDNCGQEYRVKQADLNRGWGLTCSRTCSAQKREKSKPTYIKVDKAKTS